MPGRSLVPALPTRLRPLPKLLPVRLQRSLLALLHTGRQLDGPMWRLGRRPLQAAAASIVVLILHAPAIRLAASASPGWPSLCACCRQGIRLRASYAESRQNVACGGRSCRSRLDWRLPRCVGSWRLLLLRLCVHLLPVLLLLAIYFHAGSLLASSCAAVRSAGWLRLYQICLVVLLRRCLQLIWSAQRPLRQAKQLDVPAAR